MRQFTEHGTPCRRKDTQLISQGCFQGHYLMEVRSFAWVAVSDIIRIVYGVLDEDEHA